MTHAVVPRVMLRATGADARTYLHSQLSNDISSLPAGSSCHSFLLEPTGKVVALLRVTGFDDGSFLIDFDDRPGLADVVTARLNRFRIRTDVVFEPTDLVCVAFRGETPPAELAARGTVVPAWWGGDLDLLVGGPDDWSRDDSSVERARLEAGWPAMGSEIVPGETLPSATGVVSVAVSFTKGCYPGQELVERMDSRGATAPRTLRRVRVDPGTRPGADVTVDGRTVGVITSVVGDLGLAYVDRSVDVGVPVSPPE